ncbi:MAG: DUF6152 family protein [Pseudomonadota bacterium]
MKLPAQNRPSFFAFVLCILFISQWSAFANAHHSFAMFDSENQIKLTGKVTRFDWTNPHVYIEMDVVDANGESRSWTIECANISILGRIGWKFNMIKAGDEITAIVGPLRSGQPGALLKQVTLSDGTKMGNGAPAGPPNIE